MGPFEAKVDILKHEYLKTNRYYLKKYLGLKEYILLIVLIALGVILYFLTEQIFILILTAVTIVLIAVFLLLFMVSGLKLFNAEFVNRKIDAWKFKFTDDNFFIEIHEQVINEQYTEEYIYDNIEKAAILKDRVYIYLGAATMYYIRANDFTEGSFIAFCDFLKRRLPEHKFKMRVSKIRDRVK
ncbi:MAG: hypothetical protein ACOX24_00465 [Christensenellales bacterium]